MASVANSVILRGDVVKIFMSCGFYYIVSKARFVMNGLVSESYLILILFENENY
jgi:hypothetical protein